MSAPLPCPVCGGASKAAVVGDGSRCRVFCHTALACLIGPSFPTQAEAVAAWNRLAALPVLVEALAGCLKWIEDDETHAENHKPDIPCEVCKARAALALAKGETT